MQTNKIIIKYVKIGRCQGKPGIIMYQDSRRRREKRKD
jgi:hypothetical protein